MAPPNKRNTDQFDAGAKYHVAADVGYVREEDNQLIMLPEQVAELSFRVTS
jgi:hypothetical protein